MTLEISDQNFEDEVLRAKVPVVVDFWAEWCGPCIMIAPIIDELSDEFGKKVKFFKMDVDKNSVTAAKSGIMSIPTVILFKKGEEVDRLIGAFPKDVLKGRINGLL